MMQLNLVITRSSVWLNFWIFKNSCEFLKNFRNLKNFLIGIETLAKNMDKSVFILKLSTIFRTCDFTPNRECFS